MAKYRLNKSFNSAVEPTERVTEVAVMFGLGLDQSRVITVLDDVELKIEPGNVVYITGQSGSGKSVLLGELKKQMSGTTLRSAYSAEGYEGGSPLRSTRG